MPDFWEFPTVSMGLTGINSIYQARFNRYLQNRGIKDTSDQRVWAFLGDGEMAEPESLGAIRIAAREELDNLIWVINCNLQQLDGPVTGNGKIIQELEANFRGAGWNVIKVVWGREWDSLLARTSTALLVNQMNTTPDGQFQTYSTEDGGYIREHFFGADPRLRSMVEHMSDEQIVKLPRGGHDYRKVYAAFDSATKHVGQPTVILAKTIKGWTIDALEGKNATHQMKKLTQDDLKKFRDRLYLPISDHDLERSYEETGAAPFFHPGAKAPEIEYMLERRRQLGGSMPRRVVRAEALKLPGDEMYAELKQGSGKNSIATTMAVVRLLKDWMKDPEIGKRIVPIAPDEYRTFGMDSMFPSAKVYNPGGQQYESVDRKLLLSYKESEQGQMLHEGISEAGAMASATAAGSAYSTHGEHMIPFYIFYSMFGFQRTARLDLGDGRPARPWLPDRRHRRSHDAHRRGPAARRRPLAAARDDQPRGRALRPGVRLRGQPRHAVRPRADVRHGRPRRPGRGRHLLHHRLQRAGQAAGRAGGRRRRGHPPGHPPGLHRRGRGPAGPAARLRCRLPVDRDAPRSCCATTGASWPTPGRSPRGTSWPATPSPPSSGTSSTPRTRSARPTSPTPCPATPDRSSRCPTTWPRCRCRSRAGCRPTTACSAPTGSASPTPAPPPGGSSTSTPSRSWCRRCRRWPTPARSTASRVAQAFTAYRHRRPDRRQGREAGGRRRLIAQRSGVAVRPGRSG